MTKIKLMFSIMIFRVTEITCPDITNTKFLQLAMNIWQSLIFIPAKKMVTMCQKDSFSDTAFTIYFLSNVHCFTKLFRILIKPK